MDKKENDNFDEFASDYREVHTKNVEGLTGKNSEYFSEYKIKEIATYFDTDSDISILDLGCGDGISSKFFVSEFKHCSYSGIDISEESVKIAKEKYNSVKNASFSVYDGEKIPFEENSFDLVFIACVMHHISTNYHANIINECKRVLKKNGKLIIFEHNPYNPLTLKAVNTCPFDKDAVLMKAKYLKKLCLSCGLSDISARYTIFFPRVGILEKMTPIEKHLFWFPIGGQYYVIAKK